MSEKEILHLYHRFTFGLHPIYLPAKLKLSRQDLVDELFRESERFVHLRHFDDIRKKKKNIGPLKILKMILKSRKDLQELNLVWLEHLSFTKAQLREKMTFFWHNHFATSAPFPVLMQAQNNTIRKHALGNFKELLFEVAKDPAMIIYLNNQQNKKNAPNENFAREVMELFTLGRAQYTERDIKEAARAFTGWHVGLDGFFYFDKNEHDEGEKTVLGRTGKWNGEDVLNILLEKPMLAEFICTKLYRAFVNPSADSDFIKQWAEYFRNNNYDIEKTLRYLLLSDHFYDIKNRGVVIKSPVELIAEYKRFFQLRLQKKENMIKLQRNLGQVLFLPPNVAGWPGDKKWIDGTALLIRMNLPYLFSGLSEFSPKDKDLPESATIKEKSKKPFLASLSYSGVKDVSHSGYWINAPDVSVPSSIKSVSIIEEKMRLLLSLPEYQLH